MPVLDEKRDVIIIHQTGCCPCVSKYTCGWIWAVIGALDVMGGIITAVVPSSDPSSTTVGWVTNIIIGIIIIALAWWFAIRHGPTPTVQQIAYKQIAQNLKESMPGQFGIIPLMNRLDTSIC
jgi:hypothetical protein